MEPIADQLPSVRNLSDATSRAGSGPKSARLSQHGSRKSLKVPKRAKSMKRLVSANSGSINVSEKDKDSADGLSTLSKKLHAIEMTK